MSPSSCIRAVQSRGDDLYLRGHDWQLPLSAAIHNLNTLPTSQCLTNINAQPRKIRVRPALVRQRYVRRSINVVNTNCRFFFYSALQSTPIIPRLTWCTATNTISPSSSKTRPLAQRLHLSLPTNSSGQRRLYEPPIATRSRPFSESLQPKMRRHA